MLQDMDPNVAKACGTRVADFVNVTFGRLLTRSFPCAVIQRPSTVDWLGRINGMITIAQLLVHQRVENGYPVSPASADIAWQ